jgi:hypothetical protein
MLPAIAVEPAAEPAAGIIATAPVPAMFEFVGALPVTTGLGGASEPAVGASAIRPAPPAVAPAALALSISCALSLLGKAVSSLHELAALPSKKPQLQAQHDMTTIGLCAKRFVIQAPDLTVSSAVSMGRRPATIRGRAMTTQ